MSAPKLGRPAPVDHPVHDLILERWSPRSFLARPVSEEELRSLLEAARWAPSCFNEQPWRFLVARAHQEPEGFQAMLACLGEANQVWARNAPVLMIAAAVMSFAHNGKPNRHAFHDVGLAVAQLSLQAAALGLVVHSMAGFSPELARTTFAIPEGVEPLTAIALGHPGDAESLPEDLRAREQAPRVRRPQSGFAFQGRFGTPL